MKEYRRRILEEFLDEFEAAREHHTPMNTAHEGYAVLLEEVEEMWDDIKKDDHVAARKEAIQVGAMTLALVSEIFDGLVRSD